jgi:NDP-sugar pyrophosphorylase family protein
VRVVAVDGADVGPLQAAGLDVAADDALEAAHRGTGAVATLEAVAGEPAGLVLLTDGDRRVLGVQRDPDPAEALSDLSFAGALAVSPQALDHLPDGGGFDELLDSLLEHGAHVQAWTR